MTIQPPIDRLVYNAGSAKKTVLDILRSEMRLLAKQWVIYERMEMPKKTGSLLASVDENVTDITNGVRFESRMNKYGWWVSKGTNAHPIVARNAKYLYFFWEKVGEWVAFTAVKHPGIRTPDDFVQRTWDKWYPGLESLPLRVAMKYTEAMRGKK